MNLLESLASGMRGAAGVLSPAAQQITLRQDEQAQQQAQQRKQVMAAQLIKAAEMGAIEPEAAQRQLQALGYGQMPVGPSMDVQKQRRAEAEQKAYRAALAAAGNDPVKLREVAMQFANPADILKMRAEQMDKPTEAAKKQKELEAQGYTPEVARGVAYGLLKVVPTSNGGVELIRTDLALGGRPQSAAAPQGPQVTANLQGNPEAIWAEIRSIQDPATQAQVAQAYREQLQQQQTTRGSGAQLVPGIAPGRLPGSIGGIPSRPPVDPLVAVQRPDGSTVWTPRTEAAGQPVGSPADNRAPVEKPMPASAAKGLLENQNNLRNAETVAALIKGRTVGDAKGDADATGFKGMLAGTELGDMALARLDPRGVTTRAAIANMGSLIIHDRSGAAVTAAEYPRLRPFIPKVTDNAETVTKKVNNFIREYRAIANEAIAFYRDSGYIVPDISPGSPPAAPGPAAGLPSVDAIDAELARRRERK